MLFLRRSQDRGHANHGWLDSYHTFSFAEYHDPKFMGFGVLRVINEDFIEGGRGFGMHGHSDMEIITYVIKGSLSHKDTLGNSAMIRPGEVQRMSAGTGIQHSEMNSSDETTHLLQIWILPNRRGHQATYVQKSFEEEMKRNNFLLVVSSEGEQGSLTLNQDLKLYVGKMKPGDQKEVVLREGRDAWVQLISGQIQINDQALNPGDGLAISKETKLQIKSAGTSEFLFFDLPTAI